MPAQQPEIPEGVQRNLQSVYRDICEKAGKLGLNGTTEQYIAKQMEEVRKNWYNLPPKDNISE